MTTEKSVAYYIDITTKTERRITTCLASGKKIIRKWGNVRGSERLQGSWSSFIYWAPFIRCVREGKGHLRAPVGVEGMLSADAVGKTDTCILSQSLVRPGRGTRIGPAPHPSTHCLGFLDQVNVYHSAYPRDAARRYS